MAKYKPRVIDETIVRRLRSKGAILVEGAKWCGKTTKYQTLRMEDVYNTVQQDFPILRSQQKNILIQEQ